MKIEKNVVKCECGAVMSVSCPVCHKIYWLDQSVEDTQTPAKIEINGSNKQSQPKTANDYTFKEISDLVRKGDYPFKVGDTKEINLRSFGKAVVEIIGIWHDVDINQNPVPVTWQFRELIGKNDYGGRYINKIPTNEGGWANCEMRKWLNEEFIKDLPEGLKEDIKAVVKYFDNGDKTVMTCDKIFLPSEVEVFGVAEYSADKWGYQYELYRYWKNRVKGYADGGYGRSWWLRSPQVDNSNNWCNVDSDGDIGTYSTSNSLGVAPCFAI